MVKLKKIASNKKTRTKYNLLRLSMLGLSLGLTLLLSLFVNIEYRSKSVYKFKVQPISNSLAMQNNLENTANINEQKYALGEIIIGLKVGFENINIENIINQSDKSINIKEVKIENLYDRESIIQKYKKINASVSGMSDENIFNDAYKKMPPKEKVLYRASKVKISSSVSIKEVLPKIQSNPAVEYAELNYLVDIDSLPNDPYYSSSGSWGQSYDDLWGLKKIQSNQSWDISEGGGVVVAVIDTGLDYNHEDIKSSLWVNTREIPNNGIDDDNNGFVDDVNGWDFSGDRNDGILGDNNPMDTSSVGHGTHVSGTIAAIGNNKIGIIGVAPKTKIMPVKIFPWAYDDVAANAIKYAVDNGAKALSNSWGGKGDSQLVKDAFEYAYSKGVVLVVSAGNDNVDSSMQYPAKYSSAMTVAASDYQDNKAIFSNYGAKIDIIAPGVDILSLKSSSNPGIDKPGNVVGINYYRLSGTSMSAPHVSGLAALILSKNPSLNNEEVRQIIRQSADDNPTTPGWDIYFGYGRINAYKALDMVNRNIIPPVAHIVSAVLDKNTKTVIIKGTAKSNSFSKYTIEYSYESAPTVWQIVNTSSGQIVNDVLAVVDMKNFKQGTYLFKLTAFSLLQASEDRVYLYYPTDFVLQWSSDRVYSMAVDEKNNFVYASTFYQPGSGISDLIIKYDTQGIMLKNWSVTATAKGIYVDKDGYVWAAMKTGNAINKYDSEGNLLSSFGTSAFYRNGITGDNNGNIYISSYTPFSPYESKVSKFDSKGNFLLDIGSYGSENGQFLMAMGIATDDNFLYVVDSGSDQVSKFKTDGTYIGKWGSRGNGDGQFNYPTYLAVDNNNKIYVTDSYNNRVQVFDSNGNFLYKFGSFGRDEGMFNIPLGIYADRNIPHKFVYVSSGASSVIQKFKAFNHFPALSPIGNKTVSQNQLLKFEIVVSDQDNEVTAYAVSNLPSGAQFITIAGEIPVQAQIPGLYGDVNLSGSVTSKDVDYLFQNMNTLSETQKIVSDVNGNGRVDFSDITTINDYLLGKKKYFPVILKYGDVNFDGVINSDDVNFLFQNMNTLSETQKIVSDVNGNGRVDFSDITIINDYLAGKMSSFPVTTKRFFLWKPSSAQVGYYPNIVFKATDGKDIVIESININVN